MTQATAAPPAVAMRHIDKRFGAVHANRDVALTVAAGSVHGIVGENGAGKSTLMSILYGFYEADGGEIEIEGRPARIRHSRDAIALGIGMVHQHFMLEIEGRPARIRHSRDAIALGIGMVHQHFMLVDTLSALDNVLLGAEPDWRLAPARAALRRELGALMARTGLVIDLDARVADLPVGARQRLEILKALARGARILILDEPTAVLTPQETGQLFDTLRQLRAEGTTILLITHKLKEIMALADHVTVMRQGSVVLDCTIGETSVDGLAEAMVGRHVQLGRAGAAAAPAQGAVLLQAEGLRWADALGVTRLAGVSLELRAGEVVGVAGVSGNGQSELLDALAGLLVPQQGMLRVATDASRQMAREFTPRHWLDSPMCPRTASSAAWCCRSRPGSRPCSATRRARATTGPAGCVARRCARTARR